MENNKIKILAVIRQGEFGGGETYLYNLAVNLNPDFFETVVLSYSDGNLIDMLKETGIKSHIINSQLPFNVLKYGEVKRIIKAENPDIIHLHGTRACSNAFIPARNMKKKIVYTVHGFSFHEGISGIGMFLKRKIEKYFLKNADMTVCGSESDYENAKSLCGIAKLSVIKNSIDAEKFSPITVNFKIKKELGYEENDFIICSLARLTFQKDPVTLIKAFSKIHSKYENAKLLFVGDGELKEECISEVKKHNIEYKVRFETFRSDVKDVLSMLDIFVLPSLWEVVPLGLLEAMSMEIPSIASEIPGTNEALKNNENGLTFAKGNSEELAKCIGEIIENPAKAKAMAVKARQTVIENYNLPILVRSYEELYPSLIKH